MPPPPNVAPHPSPQTEALSASYVPGGGYDEMREGPGQPIRPVWSETAAVLDRLGPEGLEQRVETVERLIREYGVSYNVYSDAGGQQEWAMDVVPFLLDGKEWSLLEEALSQRFHLLNLILHDCYGEQRLIQGGRLPPELVLGNPGFLTPAHGLLPQKFRHLHLYAADLARSADGVWWVLSDRLDAASGLGYAIENRQLSHRVMPEGLRGQPIRSLHPFVSDFCDAVEGLSPRHRENPHVVLLTPGPGNETYFEHSFLARTLGYPLVEGDDLTVRDGRVFLKSISGMRQVDVIVRRVDSDWCDPLELRSDSLLGVPGLLQAIRSGRVAVANGIGCGLLQSPAISAFLPGLCRDLLGENLRLPSVATWWCGQPAERDYVLSNLHSLVLKSAKGPALGPALFPGNHSAALQRQWRRRIERHPGDWCAQEFVNKATTPLLSGGRLHAAPFLLRVYLVRHQGGYTMMPGGLARVARGQEGSVSMQAGAVSKDVWVTGLAQVSQRERRPSQAAPTIIRRSAHSLPSRTADNLYWLGRYCERAEARTRLVRVLIDSLMDESWTGPGESIFLLFSALMPLGEMQNLKLENPQGTAGVDPDEAESLLRRWFGEELPGGGLRADIASAMRIARGVKERLSLDAWHTASHLDQRARTLPPGRQTVISDRTLQTLDSIVGLLSGLSGLFMENMVRGDGWIFQDLGRRIERALQMCNLIYSTLTPPCRNPNALLRPLLQCSDSLITYRRRYFTSLQTVSVLDLLICDPDNPRSIAFQLHRIEEHLGGLPHRAQSHALPLPLDKTSLRLTSQTGLCDVAGLAETNRGRRLKLARFLDALASGLGIFSEQLAEHYFAITYRQSTASAARGASVDLA
ncbi:MAG TPA: circularly permuted type 2 ATP-grasp protein [Verrucomicrobiales bacterium]|nr:circularly permuted type 2 ATP-grasp protein [Verrucomicrobiales bacterium]